ncbi:hypothetical protein BGX21_000150 [Mortierella sp. AD011]|nr:hypothetical protein BGX20_011656 [Mortierella sp. AD010]KAF9389236.1 hypothetical protein BGX21_000150 [Mortierella sp. AD011]
MDGAAKEILQTYPDNARVASYRKVFEEPSFARSCQKLFGPKAKSKAANNSTSSYTLRDTTIEKRKIPAPAEDPVIEVDDWDLDQVFVQGRTESVGHIIKKAAADLVPAADTLQQARRRLFTLGMSSILDLADLSPEGQLCTLFNKVQQEELKERYKYLNQLKLTTSLIPDELNLHLEMTIVQLTKGGLSAAQSYLHRIIANSTERMAKDLSLILHVVDAHACHAHLFSTRGASVDTSEMDIYANVWQPLFVKLFVGSPANLRIKIGETTMPWANKEKRSYYKDDKVVAFKIDSRVLLDHNGGEYDLVVMEVAKNTEKQDMLRWGKAIQGSQGHHQRNG